MAKRLIGVAAIAVLTAACGPGGDGSGNVGPGTQQVTVQVTGHGAVQLSTGQQCKNKCVVPVANGTSVTATASPDGGWMFSAWNGNCSGSGACQFTVDRDLELDPAFALVPTGPNQHALTIARNGSGTIRSSPAGIDCGSSCSAAFDDGTSVTLSATPDQGWRFDGWSGACSGAGDCPVAMNADATVTATFVAEQPPPPPPPADRQTLTVTIAGQGAVKSAPPGIDCPSACSADFPAGSKVTLSAAAADSGHGFAGWSGACSGQGGCAVTMTADQSVGAAFATTTQISVVISPPAVSLTTGATQRFTATVSGSTDAAVAWSVAEGPAGGSIDTTGLYTAPQAAGTFNVVAASHADPSRSATATVTVTKPTGASISSCTTITAPGTFAVTADISSLGTCLDIHDVHDVTIDCGGRTVDGAPALSMANVDRFSLTNCNFVSTGAIYNLTKVSNGTFQHDTFGTTSVNVVHATDVLIDHNTFNASYQQTYSQRVVISNNTLVSQTRGGSYTGTLIGSRSGSGNQIVGNVMDGKWSGAPVSDTDDGVLLLDRKSVV